jgi:hypothetical protein
VRPSLERLEDRLTPAPFPQFNLVNPTGSAYFGAQVVTLSTGNLVATDPVGDGGAAYLFNGHTGALISALTGLGDGPTVTALTNGNFVVDSPEWNKGVGAVTWGSGTTGVSGTVSATNSLIGSTVSDHVGGFSGAGGGVIALANGNYVVDTPTWGGNGTSNGRGAVTWGNGTTGTHGVVSAANSLVGSTVSDNVGYSNESISITALTNGNYVVDSMYWGGNLGAVTWGNGATGTSGGVSATNSLVGSTVGDYVGWGGVTALTNGNYVLDSDQWKGQAGAVTWGNGTTGISGAVSAMNSLVGSNVTPSDPDMVGSGGVTALTNGNYVVASPNWSADASTGSEIGAVTWGNGTTGISGAVSKTNSLVGANADDQIGGISNQFIGVAVGTGVTALTNGNYVVNSPDWGITSNTEAAGAGALGAVTWEKGTSAATGTVTAANSLVGYAFGDQVGNGGEVGYGGVTALADGNYVVDSPNWDNSPSNVYGGLGAVTWGNGTTGTIGLISASNSLVGSSPGDQIGVGTGGGEGGIVALTNGNYVVVSPAWNSQNGAVTWANGTTGISSTVSAANSLIGDAPGNEVGDYVSSGSGSGATALTNGNYVVFTPSQATATWGNGTTGTHGTLSSVASLTGVSGLVIQVNTLPNGNYVVTANSGLGQASDTWVNGATGTTLDGQNTIDTQNSLLGVAGAVPLFGGSAFVATFVPSTKPDPTAVSVVTIASPDASLLPPVSPPPPASPPPASPPPASPPAPPSSIDELGAYRASDGSWSLDSDGTPGFSSATDQVFFNFSPPNVTGVAGDWTGGGHTDIGDFASGTWHLDLNDNGVLDPGETFQFGRAGDQPVVGDWDGNPSGRDEIGVFRTAPDGITGEFILDVADHHAMDGSNLVFTFGLGTDHIIVGDWNGGGTSEVGVYRDAASYIPADAGDAVFSINSNGDHATFTNFVFGVITDKVVIGDWTGNGASKVGVYRDGTAFNAPGTALFSLDSGALRYIPGVSQVFLYGLDSDQFVAGHWARTPPLQPEGMPPAQFAANGRGPGATSVLTSAELAPVLAQAVANWAAQGYEVARLSTVPIHITPLTGSLVGWTYAGGITLSPDAAGWGWYTGLAPNVPANRMDLLTVVEHELGHELGYSDIDPVTYPGNIMDTTLPTGTRRTV